MTGASTGIGEASAIRLATIGYQVYAGVRKAADGARLVDQVPVGLTPVELDVTDPESIAAVGQQLEAEVGDDGLAGLFNNAGISGGGPLEFYALDDIRAMFEVNIFGLLATTQAYLPLIRKAKGRILFTGSIAGRTASPFVAPYSMTKAAVQSLCHALRVELRPWGIKVICIEPGSIATPIWQKGLDEGADRMAQMPPEAVELYGKLLPRMVKLSQDVAARAIPVERVADVVEKAMTSPRPSARYLVGNDAKAQAVVGRLPDKARDALLARFIGVPSSIDD